MEALKLVYRDISQNCAYIFFSIFLGIDGNCMRLGSINMRAFYLSILLLLFGSSACKTDVLSPKEELPAATQEGLNTFGCLVNGEVWKPRAVLSNEFTYYYHEKTLNIAAFRKIGSQNINQGLGFRIEKNLFTLVNSFYPILK